MRIVSLLPSLTELVAALGSGAELVGVTHECDEPPEVASLPRLTRSRIPESATSAEIDTLVAEQGGSLYELDVALLGALRPDLILTQAQCDVCAVNEATVRRTATALPNAPHVVSVNPTDLDGVFAMVRSVAQALGTTAEIEAERWIGTFLASWAEIMSRLVRARRAPRRVALLEWFDPPYSSGHWNPDLVVRAGGFEVLAASGERSRRRTWEEIEDTSPEVILLVPCGFTLERATEELPTLLARPEWQRLTPHQVALIDGSAYFSRPGPRLETSLRVAAAAIHPDLASDLAPPVGQGWRWVQEPR
ncbi:MAG: helical backbone metal receptor [Isosphaeraceae bacterium]